MSSARVVRCWVKSRNERNPYRPLLTRRGEDSDETAGDNSEEGGDDVKSSCPLRPGLHTCYNGYNKEKRDRKVEQNSEKYSQFRLWAATRPHEVGVASNRGSAPNICQLKFNFADVVLILFCCFVVFWAIASPIISAGGILQVDGKTLDWKARLKHCYMVMQRCV